MNDKPTLLLPMGLPASGKSTWSAQKRKENKHIYIVSRDSIREMLVNKYEDFPFGNSGLEVAVTNGVIALTSYLLSLGKSVILDETNLNTGRTRKLISDLEKHSRVSNPETEFTVEYIDFTDVPLDTCIKRDKERDRTVGENVIRGMYQKYLAHESPNKKTKK